MPYPKSQRVPCDHLNRPNRLARSCWVVCSLACSLRAFQIVGLIRLAFPAQLLSTKVLSFNAKVEACAAIRLRSLAYRPAMADERCCSSSARSASQLPPRTRHATAMHACRSSVFLRCFLRLFGHLCVGFSFTSEQRFSSTSTNRCAIFSFLPSLPVPPALPLEHPLSASAPLADSRCRHQRDSICRYPTVSLEAVLDVEVVFMDEFKMLIHGAKILWATL
jgi:hypothetical protein